MNNFSPQHLLIQITKACRQRIENNIPKNSAWSTPGSFLPADVASQMNLIQQHYQMPVLLIRNLVANIISLP